MKPGWRIGLWIMVALVLLLLALVVAGLQLGQQRMHRTVEITVEPVAYRSDAQALERGRYLYASRGCADCHGANGGGRTLVNDGKGTHLAGHNLTTGNPRMHSYKDVDWVRSIRHGVSPRGRPLRLMPSEDYNRLSNDDLAAVVAYVRQMPAVQGNEQATIELPLPARVLYGLGAIPEAVEKIDHRLPPSAHPVEAPTAEYGQYVAQMCKGCHGGQLQGGKIVGGPPDWPPASRLAPGAGSVMPRYADATSFIRMLRSGKRPDGSAISVMPFEALAQMNDTEGQALFSFLKSMPAR